MGYQLSEEEFGSIFAPSPSTPPRIEPTPSLRQEPPAPSTPVPSLRQGRPATPSFRQGESSAVTDRILDNVMHIESGGNPNAFNKNTGARGLFQFTPITMKQFQKMGLTVDPSDPESARAGARALLEMYVGEAGGDMRAALARFGGFSKKDPSGYVDRALGPPLRPSPDPDTTVPTTEAAPTESHPGMTSLFGKGHVPELAKNFPGADPAAAFVAGGMHGWLEPVSAIGQLVGTVPGLERVGERSTQMEREHIEAMRPAKEAYPELTGIGEMAGTLANPMLKLAGKARDATTAAKIGQAEQRVSPGVMSTAYQMGKEGALSNALFTPVLKDDESMAVQKFGQAVEGGLFGTIGGSAFKLLGRAGAFLGPEVLAPRLKQHVDVLRTAGVPMDAAQFTQKPELLRVRAAWFDNPATAGAAQEAIDVQRREFTRAASRTMGADTDIINAHVLSSVRDRLGRNYERLQETYGAKIDKNTLADIRDIQAAAMRTMNNSNYSTFKKLIDDGILDKMTYNSGKWVDGLDGKQLKQIQTDLGRLKNDPKFAEYANDLSELLNTAHGKNITNAADKLLLKQTNQQWGNYKALEAIAPRDPMGQVSPSQLYSYIAGRGRKFLYYRDKDDLSELAQAGKAILDQKLPNSGTTARWVMQHPYLSYPATEALKRSQKKYGGLEYDEPLRSPTKDMAAYLLSKGDELIPRPGIVSQVGARNWLEAQNEEYRQSQAPERLR